MPTVPYSGTAARFKTVLLDADARNRAGGKIAREEGKAFGGGGVVDVPAVVVR